MMVNPDPNRIGDAYFKLFNASNYRKSDKQSRIKFNSPEYVYHKDSTGKTEWKLISDEKELLLEFLNSSSADNRNFNVWTLAKFHWNNEYGEFFSNDFPEKYNSRLEAFADGYFDTKENLAHPSYLSSKLEIPDYTKL